MRVEKKPIPLTPEQSQRAADNMGLVYKMIRLPHVKKTGIDESELLSMCQLVLCDAARLFRPELGYQFSTYACRSILTVIAREVTRRKRFNDAPCHPNAATSLGPMASRVLADRSDRSASDHVSDEVAEQFSIAFAALDEREQFVLVMRVIEGATLKEVGEVLDGLSKERVRQIQDKAFAKCRAALAESAGEVALAA